MKVALGLASCTLEARKLEYDCNQTPKPREEGTPAEIVPGPYSNVLESARVLYRPWLDWLGLGKMALVLLSTFCPEFANAPGSSVSPWSFNTKPCGSKREGYHENAGLLHTEVLL